MKRWLRAIRTANGYTQQELARAADISQTAYSYIENDEKLPRLCTAKRLGEILGVSPLAFYDDSFAPGMDEFIIPERRAEETDRTRSYCMRRQRSGLDEGTAAVGRRSAVGMRFRDLKEELMELLEDESAEDAVELLDSLYEMKARIEMLEGALLEESDE